MNERRSPARPLQGRVALVAGATRGAGRGIACMLGEAGATVYCSGRTDRDHPPTGVYAGRPETIDQTAAMVTARGGAGIAVRADHAAPSEVERLIARIRIEQGRLDILVNDISEGERHDWKPFWELPLDRGLRALRNGIDTHIITARAAAPLLAASGDGLIVEIGDGDSLAYRGTLFYDLVKVAVTRLAFAMAEDLSKSRVAVVAITPGFMRTEMVLDHFKVTEANWREGKQKDRYFVRSETPFFVGRAVAALAADPGRMRKTGGLYSSWELSHEYGFTDVDGSAPNVWEILPRPTPRSGVEWTIARRTPRGASARRKPRATSGGGGRETRRPSGRSR